MTLDEIIGALRLPTPCRVDRRVPKTLLIEHGASTVADRRQVDSGIEGLRWVASIKPRHVGIAAYRDESREAVELAVLTMRLRTGAKAKRLVELVHRAVPYHLLLVTEDDDGVGLSVADKRWSQNESGQVVLDGEVVRIRAAQLELGACDGLLSSLAIDAGPRADLYALYRGWIDAVHAAQAAKVTGSFTTAETDVAAADRREALRVCDEIDARIRALRTAAAKEKQIARRVEMNLQLQALRDELATAKSKL